MTNLRFCWLLSGFGWLGLVVYLSLADVSLPQVDVQWSDKLNHLLAYGFLMGWFGQLYSRRKNRVLTAIGLIALGLLMEVVQGRLPYRWFDVADAVANAGGVVIAYFCLFLGADAILSWLEQRLEENR